MNNERTRLSNCFEGLKCMGYWVSMKFEFYFRDTLCSNCDDFKTILTGLTILQFEGVIQYSVTLLLKIIYQPKWSKLYLLMNLSNKD